MGDWIAPLTGSSTNTYPTQQPDNSLVMVPMGSILSNLSNNSSAASTPPTASVLDIPTLLSNNASTPPVAPSPSVEEMAMQQDLRPPIQEPMPPDMGLPGRNTVEQDPSRPDRGEPMAQSPLEPVQGPMPPDPRQAEAKPNLSNLSRDELLALLDAQNPGPPLPPRPTGPEPAYLQVNPLQTAQVYILQNGQAVNTGTTIFVSDFLTLANQTPEPAMDMLKPPPILVDGVDISEPPAQPVPPGYNPYIPQLVDANAALANMANAAANGGLIGGMPAPGFTNTPTQAIPFDLGQQQEMPPAPVNILGTLLNLIPIPPILAPFFPSASPTPALENPPSNPYDGGYGGGLGGFGGGYGAPLG